MRERFAIMLADRAWLPWAVAVGVVVAGTVGLAMVTSAPPTPFMRLC